MYFSKPMTQAVFLAQIISSQMALQDVVRCVIVCSELQCLRQSLVSRSESTLTRKYYTNTIQICNTNTNTNTTSVFSSKSGFTLRVHPHQQPTTRNCTLHVVVQLKRSLRLCGSRVWLVFQPTTRNCTWLSK